MVSLEIFSICFLVIVYSFFFATLDRKVPVQSPAGTCSFLIARDEWQPRLGAICHGLLNNLHAPAEDRTLDPSI